MGDLVRTYYFVLRSVLQTKPHLRRFRTRCRHCLIFFLTHPRNAGRRDLGCPFGCRSAHRKHRSTERSTAYYRTDHGRVKKKLQNAKRGHGEAKAAGGKDPETKRGAGERDGRRLEARLAGGMVAYVRVVVSLIEGRWVRREEIVAMLERAVRQHSMSREKRIDYVLRTLKENPP